MASIYDKDNIDDPNIYDLDPNINNNVDNYGFETTMPAPSGGVGDIVSGFTAVSAKDIPFVGGFVEGANYARVAYLAQKKDLTKDEAFELKTSLDDLEEDSNRSWEYEAGSTMRNAITFATELGGAALLTAMTGGFGAVSVAEIGAGKVASAGGKKLALKALKNYSETFVKKKLVKDRGLDAIGKNIGRKLISRGYRNSTTGKLAMKALTKAPALTALVAADNLVTSDNIYSGTQRRKMDAVFKGQDPDSVNAFGNALMDNIIENLSEHSGYALGKAVGKVVPDKIKAKLTKLAFLKHFGRGEGLGEKKLQEIFHSMGVNGVLEEMGEERLGGFARGILGVDDNDFGSISDAVRESLPQTWDQLKSEVVAFTIPGLARQSLYSAYGSVQAPIELRKRIKDLTKDSLPVPEGKTDSEYLQDFRTMLNSPLSEQNNSLLESKDVPKILNGIKARNLKGKSPKKAAKEDLKLMYAPEYHSLIDKIDTSDSGAVYNLNQEIKALKYDEIKNELPSYLQTKEGRKRLLDMDSNSKNTTGDRLRYLSAKIKDIKKLREFNTEYESKLSSIDKFTHNVNSASTVDIASARDDIGINSPYLSKSQKQYFVGVNPAAFTEETTLKDVVSIDEDIANGLALSNVEPSAAMNQLNTLSAKQKYILDYQQRVAEQIKLDEQQTTEMEQEMAVESEQSVQQEDENIPAVLEKEDNKKGLKPTGSTDSNIRIKPNKKVDFEKQRTEQLLTDLSEFRKNITGTQADFEKLSSIAKKIESSKKSDYKKLDYTEVDKIFNDIKTKLSSNKKVGDKVSIKNDKNIASSIVKEEKNISHSQDRERIAVIAKGVVTESSNYKDDFRAIVSSFRTQYPSSSLNNRTLGVYAKTAIGILSSKLKLGKVKPTFEVDKRVHDQMVSAFGFSGGVDIYNSEDLFDTLMKLEKGYSESHQRATSVLRFGDILFGSDFDKTSLIEIAKISDLSTIEKFIRDNILPETKESFEGNLNSIDINTAYKALASKFKMFYNSIMPVEVVRVEGKDKYSAKNVLFEYRKDLKAPYLANTTYVFLDIETTGLYEHDDIFQISLSVGKNNSDKDSHTLKTEVKDFMFEIKDINSKLQNVSIFADNKTLKEKIKKYEDPNNSDYTYDTPASFLEYIKSLYPGETGKIIFSGHNIVDFDLSRLGKDSHFGNGSFLFNLFPSEMNSRINVIDTLTEYKNLSLDSQVRLNQSDLLRYISYTDEKAGIESEARNLYKDINKAHDSSYDVQVNKVLFEKIRNIKSHNVIDNDYVTDPSKMLTSVNKSTALDTLLIAIDKSDYLLDDVVKYLGKPYDINKYNQMSIDEKIVFNTERNQLLFKELGIKDSYAYARIFGDIIPFNTSVHNNIKDWFCSQDIKGKVQSSIVSNVAKYDPSFYNSDGNSQGSYILKSAAFPSEMVANGEIVLLDQDSLKSSREVFDTSFKLWYHALSENEHKDQNTFISLMLPYGDKTSVFGFRTEMSSTKEMLDNTSPLSSSSMPSEFMYSIRTILGLNNYSNKKRSNYEQGIARAYYRAFEQDFMNALAKQKKLHMGSKMLDNSNTFAEAISRAASLASPGVQYDPSIVGDKMVTATIKLSNEEFMNFMKHTDDKEFDSDVYFNSIDGVAFLSDNDMMTLSKARGRTTSGASVKHVYTAKHEDSSYHIEKFKHENIDQLIDMGSVVDSPSKSLELYKMIKEKMVELEKKYNSSGTQHIISVNLEIEGEGNTAVKVKGSGKYDINGNTESIVLSTEGLLFQEESDYESKEKTRDIYTQFFANFSIDSVFQSAFLDDLSGNVKDIKSADITVKDLKSGAIFTDLVNDSSVKYMLDHFDDYKDNYELNRQIKDLRLSQLNSSVMPKIKTTSHKTMSSAGFNLRSSRLDKKYGFVAGEAIFAAPKGTREHAYFDSQSKANAYARKLNDIIPARDVFFDFKIGKYVVPGELVVLNRLPSSDWHQHNVARLKKNLNNTEKYKNSSAIFIPAYNDNLAGGDKDGDAVYIVYGKYAILANNAIASNPSRYFTSTDKTALDDVFFGKGNKGPVSKLKVVKSFADFANDHETARLGKNLIGIIASAMTKYKYDQAFLEGHTDSKEVQEAVASALDVYMQIIVDNSKAFVADQYFLDRKFIIPMIFAVTNPLKNETGKGKEIVNNRIKYFLDLMRSPEERNYISLYSNYMNNGDSSFLALKKLSDKSQFKQFAEMANTQMNKSNFLYKIFTHKFTRVSDVAVAYNDNLEENLSLITNPKMKKAIKSYYDRAFYMFKGLPEFALDGKFYNYGYDKQNSYVRDMYRSAGYAALNSIKSLDDLKNDIFNDSKELESLSKLEGLLYDNTGVIGYNVPTMVPSENFEKGFKKIWDSLSDNVKLYFINSNALFHLNKGWMFKGRAFSLIPFEYKTAWLEKYSNAISKIDFTQNKAVDYLSVLKDSSKGSNATIEKLHERILETFQSYPYLVLTDGNESYYDVNSDSIFLAANADHNVLIHELLHSAYTYQYLSNSEFSGKINALFKLAYNLDFSEDVDFEQVNEFLIAFAMESNQEFDGKKQDFDKFLKQGIKNAIKKDPKLMLFDMPLFLREQIKVVVDAYTNGEDFDAVFDEFWNIMYSDITSYIMRGKKAFVMKGLRSYNNIRPTAKLYDKTKKRGPPISSFEKSIDLFISEIDIAKARSHNISNIIAAKAKESSKKPVEQLESWAKDFKQILKNPNSNKSSYAYIIYKSLKSFAKKSGLDDSTIKSLFTSTSGIERIVELLERRFGRKVNSNATDKQIIDSFKKAFPLEDVDLIVNRKENLSGIANRLINKITMKSQSIELIKTLNELNLISSEKRAGYDEIENPFFRVVVKASQGDLYSWVAPDGSREKFAPVYVKRDIAKQLNNMLGESKLKNVAGMDKLDAFVKFSKMMSIQFGFFHHAAFLRSHYFMNPDFQLNPIKSMKKGLKIFSDAMSGTPKKATVEDLKDPAVALYHLLKAGLTSFSSEEFSDSNSFETALGSWMRDQGGVIEKIANGGAEASRKFSYNLFAEFGAGLKYNAAIAELEHQMKKLRNDKDIPAILKAVASNINADFGGINQLRERKLFGVIDRNPTRQHIFRSLSFAPDWFESNFLLLSKAVQNGNSEEKKIAQQQLTRLMVRVSTIYLVANVAMTLLTGDDPDEENDNFFKKFKRRFDNAWNQGDLKWLDIDVSPLLPISKGTTAYFNPAGHFKDYLKWIPDLTLSDPNETITGNASQFLYHKTSTPFTMLYELVTGKNSFGQNFTTVNELMKKGHLTVYSKGESGVDAVTKRPFQLPSWFMAQIEKLTPISARNATKLVSSKSGEKTLKLTSDLAALNLSFRKSRNIEKVDTVGAFNSVYNLIKQVMPGTAKPNHIARVGKMVIDIPELVKNSDFMLEMDAKSKQPLWVSERVSKSKFIGSSNIKRPSGFKEMVGALTNHDYGSLPGVDRGHLAAAGNYNTKKTKKGTFITSNLSPQDADFNRGKWKELESWVRDNSLMQDVDVYTGPILDEFDQKLNGVRIPRRFYKIVVKDNKAIGFILPNKKIKGNLQDYATTVEDIEKLTRIDFQTGANESALNTKDWNWIPRSFQR